MSGFDSRPNLDMTLDFSSEKMANWVASKDIEESCSNLLSVSTNVIGDHPIPRNEQISNTSLIPNTF